jgi:hypothetical protein
MFQQFDQSFSNLKQFLALLATFHKKILVKTDENWSIFCAIKHPPSVTDCLHCLLIWPLAG